VTFTAILFDLDGTLIDSIELILESYRHTLRVHRGASPPDAVWLEGLGTPLRKQFRHFTDDPAEIEAMVATYRGWNLANHDRMVVAYPGALETVQALKARGARLGIVTSKNLGGLQRGLDHCDSITESKPDPAPVRLALGALGARPEEALMVGDSPHDIASGRDAGTRTAACLWGPFDQARLLQERPDYMLSSFSELAALCNGAAPGA
jgi:pyrophosphatase PpaX